MVEQDSSVTVSLLGADGRARLVIRPKPGVLAWTAMALRAGGTIAVMVMPGLPSADLLHIGDLLGSDDGEYWYLSVGYIL